MGLTVSSIGTDSQSESRVCYDYVERGKCITIDCGFAHDLSLVLPAVQRLCDQKKLGRLTKMVRCMASNMSPMNKVIFTDYGRNVVRTAINAIIKVNTTI